MNAQTDSLSSGLYPEASCRTASPRRREDFAKGAKGLRALLAITLLAGAVAGACAPTGHANDAASGAASASGEPTLKDEFSGAFMIGSALNRRQVTGQDEPAAEIARRHFNTITAENDMKWERIHPEPDRYDWEPADRFVEFGEQNRMFVVGHTLVWHSQTPRWVFEDAEGNPLTRDALIERMREHIHTVAGRYRGRVHGWDVVNEALNEDGSLRDSPWRRIIGDDYIELAFRFAHEADPDAELYYNDYSVENAPKRAGAVRIIQTLQDAGVPVHGMGLQGHNHLDWPTRAQQDSTIRAFADLGVKVMITELDVDVLPSASGYQGADISVRAELEERLNPYTDGLPDEMQETLARRYAELFDIYLEHREHVSRVTFWGVTDGHSWKNNFPVRGRTNYPLLFDRDHQPKPAFHAVVETARRHRASE
jgi:endo-1,4-beta-xylanase